MTPSDFYTVSVDGAEITCHVCGFTSKDARHAREKFCPRCGVFHEDRIFMTRLAQGYETEFHSRSEEAEHSPLAASGA